MHFIVVCTLYKSERQQLFDNVCGIYPNFNDMSDMEKFILLFKSKDANILTWLGGYINASFEIRNKKIRMS